MMDLMSVVTYAMRAQMLTNAALAAQVIQPDGQYKIFFEQAPGLVDTPYIKMTHIWGGDLNQAPSKSFDMTYVVSVVAKTSPQARQILGLVREALLDAFLPYPDGWEDWAGLTVTGNFKELVNIQGTQYWDLGMFVRLRGSRPAVS